MIGVIRGIRPIFLCLVTLAVWPLLAAEGPKEPGGQPAAEKPGKEKAAGEKPAEKPDPYVVPEGTPKDLVAYIRKLAPLPVRDAATMEKKRQAILKAAEKILAAKASDQEAELAAQAKISTLGDVKKIAAFGEELQKAGRKNLARMGRGICLQIELGKAINEGPEKIKKGVDNIVKFLEEAPPRRGDAALVEDISRNVVEPLGDDQWAAAVHRSLAKVFASSKDPQLVEFAKLLEGTARRLTLPGNEIKIEGKLLDGKPFDWSKYAGKVVLVDFWATWCRPCLAEIPQLRKYYDFYHDKGFDIVGVSGDFRLVDLQRYVQEKKIPWPIVFDGEQPSPTVAYYGIYKFPTMILVDKNGKVVSLNASDPFLKESLEKLLGPMPPPKKDEAKKGDNLYQPNKHKPNGGDAK